MFSVIMAGGSGTRFWPKSRMKIPKQFLNISGTEPMLVETANRLASITNDEEMILIVGREHLGETERLFSGRKVHILAEPVGRNTAPCIGLGAVHAESMGYDGPIAFMPADHFIANQKTFMEDLECAGEAAETGAIVTLGIVPTKPETGYGYIKRTDNETLFKGKPVFDVSGFKEKPDPERAMQYVSKGDYLWNAGIFIVRPDTILKEIEIHLPDLYKGLRELQESIGSSSFESTFERVYEKLEKISFDYGIMERTESRVMVRPCECGWSDVGSWESLYELRKEECDSDMNHSEGNTIMIDCKENLVSGNTDRLIACLGLNNCLIVDTKDALLVADIAKSQDIKKIVKLLREKGKDELI